MRLISKMMMSAGPNLKPPTDPEASDFQDDHIRFPCSGQGFDGYNVVKY
jgi:hypothetical protein